MTELSWTDALIIFCVKPHGRGSAKGNFSSWWENRERRNHFEAVENEKHRREAKRLENAAQRASNWSTELEKTKYGSRNSGLRPDRGYIGHKSAKMMKRAKAMETRLEAAAVEQKETVAES